MIRWLSRTLLLAARSAMIALVAVAAALGIAGTLGLTRWDRADPDAWVTLLAWVAVSFSLAVVAGATLARPTRPERFLAATAAALGAAVAVPLAVLPARGTHLTVPGDPRLIVALAAAAGTLVGFGVALVALATAPVAAGVGITAAWVWVGGIAAGILDLVGTARPAPLPGIVLPDRPLVMVGLAALVGAGVAAHARWATARTTPTRTTPTRTADTQAGSTRFIPSAGRVGTAFAGAVGPLLVALADLIAGSRDSAPTVLLAVTAGLAASTLVALPRRSAPAPALAAPTAALVAAPTPTPPPPTASSVAAPSPAAPLPSPAAPLPSPAAPLAAPSPATPLPALAPVSPAAPEPAERPRPAIGTAPVVARPAWAGEYRVPLVPPRR